MAKPFFLQNARKLWFLGKAMYLRSPADAISTRFNEAEKITHRRASGEKLANKKSGNAFFGDLPDRPRIAQYGQYLGAESENGPQSLAIGFFLTMFDDRDRRMTKMRGRDLAQGFDVSPNTNGDLIFVLSHGNDSILRGNYAGAEYRQTLARAGMSQSMSRADNCYDNAFMESCFGTLKTELEMKRYENDGLAQEGSGRLHPILQHQTPTFGSGLSHT